MINTDYDILTAVNEGGLYSFMENYPPNEEGVSQRVFERLHREGYIHTEADTSASEMWGYIGVNLTSKGIMLLNELEIARAESASKFARMRPGLKKLTLFIGAAVITPIVVAVITGYLTSS